MMRSPGTDLAPFGQLVLWMLGIGTVRDADLCDCGDRDHMEPVAVFKLSKSGRISYFVSEASSTTELVPPLYSRPPRIAGTCLSWCLIQHRDIVRGSASRLQRSRTGGFS